MFYAPRTDTFYAPHHGYVLHSTAWIHLRSACAKRMHDASVNVSAVQNVKCMHNVERKTSPRCDAERQTYPRHGACDAERKTSPRSGKCIHDAERQTSCQYRAPNACATRSVWYRYADVKSTMRSVKRINAPRRGYVKRIDNAVYCWHFFSLLWRSIKTTSPAQWRD